MGSVGDCYDNMMAEISFASLECELIERRTWRTRGEAKTALFRWIEGRYDLRRRHSRLGQLAPAVHEERHAQSMASATEPEVA